MAGLLRPQSQLLTTLKGGGVVEEGAGLLLMSGNAVTISQRLWGRPEVEPLLQPHSAGGAAHWLVQGIWEENHSIYTTRCSAHMT